MRIASLLMTTLALSAFGFLPAHAYEDCTLTLPGKTPEKLEIHPVGEDVIRIRYQGSRPDEFYAGVSRISDKQETTFVQFATRKDQKSLLDLKTDRRSQVKMTMLMGGNSFARVLRGKETEMACTRTESPEKK